MRTIHLQGQASTREIFLDGERLSPEKSLKVRNHSPDGFNWGYAGSGPAQLALAICLEIIGSDCNYQSFKFDYIATIPPGDFDVTIEFNPNNYKRQSL